MSTEYPLEIAKGSFTPDNGLKLACYHNLNPKVPFLLDAFEEWIGSLDPERDGGEMGRGTLSTRNWLGYQDFMRPPGHPLFATYIHYNEPHGKRLPLSTVTLAKDDRNVLVNHGVKAYGVWGLFIVHHEFRKKGFATALAKAVDGRIQSVVNETGEPQDWVTFSGDETAIKILSGVGFVHEGEVTIHQAGYNNGEPSTEQLHRRQYRPQS